MKMKRIGMKLIVCLLIFLTLFNFIISTSERISIVYADEGEEDADDETSDVDDTENTVTSLLGSVLNGIAGILTWIPRAMMVAAGAALQIAGYTIVASAGTSDEEETSVFITPFDIFFNKFTLTNINVFQTDDLKDENDNIDTSSLVYKIRENISMLFYIVLAISLAVLLVILILNGLKSLGAIKMGKASQESQGKEALVDWLVTALLVVFMSMIVAGIILINEQFVSALSNIADNAGISDYMNELATSALSLGFLKGWASTITYFLMVIQTFIFIFVYIIRFFTVAFLIIVSPAVPVLQAVANFTGKHSKILNTWFREFLYNVFIQIIHCIIYIAIVGVPLAAMIDADSTTWEGIAAAILSVVAMMSVKKIEELLKQIFGFNKASSLSSYSSIVNATGINTTKMVSGATQTAVHYGMNVNQKVAGVAKKGANFASDAVHNKNQRFVEANPDGKLAKFENTVSGAYNTAKDTVTSAKDSVKRKVEGARGWVSTGLNNIRSGNWGSTYDGGLAVISPPVTEKTQAEQTMGSRTNTSEQKTESGTNTSEQKTESVKQMRRR